MDLPPLSKLIYFHSRLRFITIINHYYFHRAASNIIFSNGLLDPWHAGGVLEDVNPTVRAITIAEGAHHLDMRGSDPSDPESVIVARRQEVEFIGMWLRQVREKKRRTGFNVEF